MRTKFFGTILASLGALLTASQAQETAIPDGETNLIYFDEAIGFKEFYKTSVYGGWRNRKSFFLLPTAVRDIPNDTISLHYQNRNGRLTGTITLSIQPAFESNEFEAITTQLKTLYPDGKFVVVEPITSEWEFLGYGERRSLTPTMMSNPLLSSTSITVEIPEPLIKALLHQGSHYADVFVIRHKFAVKGVEIDKDFKPRITTRWFSRGVSLQGTCDVFPERFINVDTGASGCVYRVVAHRDNIVDVQEMLKKLSLYNGPVDGILGTKTRQGIRAFQGTAGMQRDGAVSSMLMTKLREALVPIGG